jgi:hypothetical protein
MIRKLLLASAFCALAIPAYAATLCVQLTSPTYTGQQCGTVADAAIPAFFAAYANSYGTVTVPGVNGAQPTTRAATNDEEFKMFASGLAQGVADNVVSFLKAQAKAAAEAQVPAVTITPQ